jgi:hypothetical protein
MAGEFILASSPVSVNGLKRRAARLATICVKDRISDQISAKVMGAILDDALLRQAHRREDPRHPKCDCLAGPGSSTWGSVALLLQKPEAPNMLEDMV